MGLSELADMVWNIMKKIHEKRRYPMCPLCSVPMEDLGEEPDESGAIPYWICPQHGGVIRYEQIEENEKEKANIRRKTEGDT